MQHPTDIRGFTLIETMVAIALLSVAIVAPMSLTSQSLSAAFYARDQITAFNLAQEGLEAVRSIRDGQILQITRAEDASSIDLFGSIPNDVNFAVDSRESDAEDAIHVCPSSGCPPLQAQTDGDLFGYRPGCPWPTNNCTNAQGWANTNFTRTLRASYVDAQQQEIRLESTVTWYTGARSHTFTISENLYRWVEDGSAITL